MNVKVLDSKTIQLEPEDVAEIELLRKFESCKVLLIKARPFDPNVTKLQLSIFAPKAQAQEGDV